MEEKEMRKNTNKEQQKLIKKQKKEMKMTSKEVLKRAYAYASPKVVAACKCELKTINERYKAKVALECVIINNQYLQSNLKDLQELIGDYNAAKENEKFHIEKKLFTLINDVQEFTRIRTTLLDASSEKEATRRNVDAIIGKLQSLKKEEEDKAFKFKDAYLQYKNDPSNLKAENQAKNIQIEIELLKSRLTRMSVVLENLRAYLKKSGLEQEFKTIGSIENTLDINQINVELESLTSNLEMLDLESETNFEFSNQNLDSFAEQQGIHHSKLEQKTTETNSSKIKIAY